MRIAANHTANIVSTGNSAIVASVGYTAAVTANKPTNVLTDIICTYIFAGNAGCINNISNCTTSTIFTNNTAYFIFAADDAFVITTVHIAVVCTNDAANIAAIGCTAVGNAKAIHILNIAVVYAYHAAKASTCTTSNICIYCYRAVAEAVGKAAIICANQTTCNGTGTACNNTACAFNIVNSAVVVINTNNAACIAIRCYSVAKGYNAFNASVVYACNSTGVLAACKCTAVNINVFNNAVCTNSIKNACVAICIFNL